MAEERYASRIDIPAEGFGQVVRHLRAHAGMSQHELAVASGLSPAMIAKLENASRNPSRKTLVTVSGALGLRAEQLREAAHAWQDALDGDDTAAIEALGDQLVAASRPRRSHPVGGQVTLAAEMPAYPDRPLEHRVADFPAGRVGHVAPEAVAVEGETCWVDPQAAASAVGVPDRDPRFERLDDGRVRLDLSRVDRGTLASRDPDRHVLRATLVGAEPPDPEELADVYASTVLVMDWDGREVVVAPAPEGVTEGAFPEGVSVVHVLTAQNPRSRLLLGTENEERNRSLEPQLRRRGWTVHPATGRSPDGAWSEDGFAIVDAPRDEVLELARDAEQNAIFEWTAEERAVIWCDHDRRDTHGWSVT